MSGDLEIRSGGVIAVDTAVLRDAAAAWRGLAGRCDQAAEQLRRAGALAAGDVLLADHPHVAATAASHSADRIARDLQALAVAYEIVELDAARAAAAAAGEQGDQGGAAVAAARLDALRAAHPVEAAHARHLLRAWDDSRHAELESQILEAALPFAGAGWLAVPVARAALELVRDLGLGTVPAGARLHGPPAGVTVRESRRGSATPPTSLADLTRRVPGDDVRVRVERYTMPDGSRQFAAYIPGTQAMRGGRVEPFDMGSNVRLYTGGRADALVAVQTALRRAGAGAGDAVHLVGHSQGAMIASRLAREGDVRVATLVTVGSPVHADVPDTTLQVVLRHSDDPVVALAAGGTAHATGAPGGFVAERVADPGGSVADLALDVHHLETYIETAALVDASDDPRVGGILPVFDELGTAVEVEAFEFTATRGAAAGPPGGPPQAAR